MSVRNFVRYIICEFVLKKSCIALRGITSKARGAPKRNGKREPSRPLKNHPPKDPKEVELRKKTKYIPRKPLWGKLAFATGFPDAGTHAFGLLIDRTVTRKARDPKEFERDRVDKYAQ